MKETITPAESGVGESIVSTDSPGGSGEGKRIKNIRHPNPRLSAANATCVSSTTDNPKTGDNLFARGSADNLAKAVSSSVSVGSTEKVSLIF